MDSNGRSIIYEFLIILHFMVTNLLIIVTTFFAILLTSKNFNSLLQQSLLAIPYTRCLSLNLTKIPLYDYVELNAMPSLSSFSLNHKIKLPLMLFKLDGSISLNMLKFYQLGNIEKCCHRQYF